MKQNFCQLLKRLFLLDQPCININLAPRIKLTYRMSIDDNQMIKRETQWNEVKIFVDWNGKKIKYLNQTEMLKELCTIRSYCSVSQLVISSYPFGPEIFCNLLLFENWYYVRQSFDDRSNPTCFPYFQLILVFPTFARQHSIN